MSRGAFREPVASPRPPAALAMVTIALATIAVTGQIAPWALGLGGASVVAAIRLRARPFDWQRSPLLLNGGLAIAVAAGAAVFARGAYAMIALAHFAILAQGLQLLDARPRRSEFLLVALALFLVILAANLTDSAAFPLLLVAFTVATVWTLVVHTLRAEALEAHEPEAARRALQGGLRRTITLASLAAVVLGLVLFPLLPRLRTGSLLSTGLGPSAGVSGFAERVALGDLGRIRLDPRVALRVETLEGPEAGPDERYVRGLAFDHFDGRRWSVTPRARRRVPGDPERGVALAADPRARRRGPKVVQRITREPMETGVVFAPGRLLAVTGSLGRLEIDAGGALHAHRTAGARIDYRVTSRVGRHRDGDLVGDRVRPPGGDGGRHLDLPPLAPGVAELARRVTGGEPDDASRVRALETWLRREGRYTDQPPIVPADDPRSPVEAFLEGGMAGHCEYFASAMAVMARSLGIPARIVNGFAGGTENPVGDFVEFSRSDAHTWVEVHYAGAGWVRYDPTPPDLRRAGALALRDGSRLAALLSAAELWWFRNVVDFDRSTQLRALRGLYQRLRALRATPGDPSAGTATGGDTPAWPRPSLGGLLLVAGLALALVAGVHRLRRRRGPRLPADYARALRLLARRGLERGPATTARAFAAEAGERIPPRAARAFHELTEAYLHERFGGGAATRETAAALAALRQALEGRTVHFGSAPS